MDTKKQKEFAEWWKQLFGESDGKENTGIFFQRVLILPQIYIL